MHLEYLNANRSKKKVQKIVWYFGAYCNAPSLYRGVARKVMTKIKITTKILINTSDADAEYRKKVQDKLKTTEVLWQP